MRTRVYSTFQAKAKFSEILRAVREGQTVTVSSRGEPVAETRPISGVVEDFDDRVQRLADRGILGPPEKRVDRLRPIARKPGALQRFLAERDE